MGKPSHAIQLLIFRERFLFFMDSKAMDYNLRDLRFFEAVADLGHLGRAAEMLGRSQPAITKCIRRLESSVGSPLFQREGRGIQLTPVGALLMARARQLLRHAAEVGRELNDFSAGHSGHVRIGGGLITAGHVIPDVCTKILEDSPDVTFEIIIATNVSLREELREGRIDLLLGQTAVADRDFLTVPLINDVVVPAARRTHPIFKKRHRDLDTMLMYPWALPSRAIPSRQWLDIALSSRGLTLPVAHIETNSPPLLPRIIGGADLISFIPRRMISANRHYGLREIVIPEITLQRDFGVTYRHGGYLSRAAQRVLELMVSEGKALFGLSRQDEHGHDSCH